MGIDLDLKQCATASTGETIEGRWYRDHEQALGIAQGANKKQRVRAIHVRIKKQRKVGQNQDGQEHAGCALVSAQDDVGIQEPSGWYRLRGRQRKPHDPDLFVLREHCRQQSERYSRFASKRMGLQRMWNGYDRAINAAKNILAEGRDIAVLQRESPSLHGGEDVSAQHGPPPFAAPNAD